MCFFWNRFSFVTRTCALAPYTPGFHGLM